MKPLQRNKLLQPDGAKKNFAFQLLYHVVILLLPLVVSPYLTRTLGGTSLGVYTYTYSIAYYFVLFAMLGINKHGQRIISQRREDVLALRKTFWSLYAVHFVASVLALFAYVIYVLFVCGSDRTIAFIQAIYVASAIFDLTWLFYGLEKFKIVAIRNAIVRIINAFCIFVFIKSPSDIGLYTAIMVVTSCMGNIILIPKVLSALPPIRFSIDDIREHLKPLFILFVAVAAISLYTVFDKTLLGILATKEDVAYYEYSNQIINVPKVFIGIISTVLYPKACVYAADKEWNKMRENFNASLKVTCSIGFASFFGLLAVAKPFALIYYGKEFAVCGNVIMWMCPLILIIGIGETFRLQYIYPLKMDAIMVKILTLNAVINIILSSTMIPALGIIGAVVGTIVAEMFGLVIEMRLVNKFFSLRFVAKECIPFFMCGALMYVIVRILGSILTMSLIVLLVQVVVGAAVYSGFYILYCFLFDKEMLNYIRDMVKNVIRKFVRKKV